MTVAALDFRRGTGGRESSELLGAEGQSKTSLNKPCDAGIGPCLSVVTTSDSGETCTDDVSCTHPVHPHKKPRQSPGLSLRCFILRCLRLRLAIIGAVESRAFEKDVDVAADQAAYFAAASGTTIQGICGYLLDEFKAAAVAAFVLVGRHGDTSRTDIWMVRP
jgi:hypothetical protein